MKTNDNKELLSLFILSKRRAVLRPHPVPPVEMPRLALLACLVALPLGAQQPAAPPARFTVDDALDLTAYRLVDLSDDGAWLAATSTARRDGLTVDYRRDGDPTYLRPQPSRIWVIDTHTGATRALFPDKRDVGALRWSPDATRLALLVRKGDA